MIYHDISDYCAAWLYPAAPILSAKIFFVEQKFLTFFLLKIFLRKKSGPPRIFFVITSIKAPFRGKLDDIRKF